MQITPLCPGDDPINVGTDGLCARLKGLDAVVDEK